MTIVAKNVCWRSRQFGISAEVSTRHFGTGADCRIVPTLRHQSDGAEMSCIRSVLGPKCLDTVPMPSAAASLTVVTVGCLLELSFKKPPKIRYLIV